MQGRAEGKKEVDGTLAPQQRKRLESGRVSGVVNLVADTPKRLSQSNQSWIVGAGYDIDVPHMMLAHSIHSLNSPCTIVSRVYSCSQRRDAHNSAVLSAS